MLKRNLNEKKYSILWHACKDDNLDCVKSIMNIYPELIHENGPDGTSPHFMAFIKGHSKIIEYMENVFKIDIKYEETKCDGNESYMIKLTEKFPVFNDEIENKCSFKIPKTIEKFKTLPKYVLGDICMFENVSYKDNIVYLQEIDFKECKKDCKK